MTYRIREDKIFDLDSSGQLFNHLKKRYNLHSDGALAKWLETSQSTVSKIRHGTKEVMPTLILTILEKTDLSYKEVKLMILDGGYRANIQGSSPTDNDKRATG